MWDTPANLSGVLVRDPMATNLDACWASRASRRQRSSTASQSGDQPDRDAQLVALEEITRPSTDSSVLSGKKKFIDKVFNKLQSRLEPLL